MDVHVNAAITAGVRRRGIDVLTAQEDGSRRFADERLLERATALQRVLFSQDDDFLTIARNQQLSAVVFSGLIYGHQLAATVGKSIPSPKWKICLFSLIGYNIWCVLILLTYHIWYGLQIKSPKTKIGEGIVGKYVLDLDLVCQVLAPEDIHNRVEYLPLD